MYFGGAKDRFYAEPTESIAALKIKIRDIINKTDLLFLTIKD